MFYRWILQTSVVSNTGKYYNTACLATIFRPFRQPSAGKAINVMWIQRVLQYFPKHFAGRSPGIHSNTTCFNVYFCSPGRPVGGPGCQNLTNTPCSIGIFQRLLWSTTRKSTMMLHVYRPYAGLFVSQAPEKQWNSCEYSVLYSVPLHALLADP